MRKLIFLILFFSSVIYTNDFFAQSNDLDGEKIFQQANTFVAQKNYAEAIKNYELLLENDLESAEVFFNLGNCFYQTKKWGKAILNYERALLLDPNDKTILQNLELANDKTIDEIEKIPAFFLAKWWDNIRQFASSGIWSILGILLLWGGIGGMVLWILGKERSQRKRGFLIGWGILALSLVTFALAYSSFKIQQNSGAAIIMNQEISLKTLPDEISNEIMPLHEGTKVEILEKITSWYKVRLENGEVGWIKNTTLEEI